MSTREQFLKEMQGLIKRNLEAEKNEPISYFDTLQRSMQAEMDRLLTKALSDYVAANPDATKVYFYITNEQAQYTMKTTYHFIEPNSGAIIMPPAGIRSIQEVDLGKFKQMVNNGVIKI